MVFIFDAIFCIFALISPGGGIGIRATLKMWSPKGGVGSSPTWGTMDNLKTTNINPVEKRGSFYYIQTKASAAQVTRIAKKITREMEEKMKELWGGESTTSKTV